ncbi:peptidoglycan DD-metalloendopeptidase family protein [Saccharopolyspora rosea]|uniref:peptidoglycan DD-metalloendopeptidase family protein n=1 Tax=Saccharopolyspora rosea TaxID=524884 RepID=UPI0021D97BD1|nr:peptidoglycan DD-metalloendopeptidase family protein [Saccharopolyspora rosea]
MLKLSTALIGFIFGLIVLVAAAVSGVVSAVFGGGDSATSGPPSQAALADIPGKYLTLYQQAATTCPGLDWSILAAIGKIETDHGRSNLSGVHSGSNSAGAGGPMQFLQASFDSVVARHPPPPGGSTPPSRYNPHDAIYAAAAYLCDSGARDGDLHSAIFAYNHADWYVNKVLAQAQRYRAAAATPPASADGWVLPVAGRCSSGFGPRDGQFHQGQDLAAPIGTPIVAAAEGTVLNAGPAGGYGLWVRIQHPDGTISTYGHINASHVTAGQHVTPGQPIAEVGNRGQSTGPHLHFQLDTREGPVDPVAFYEQKGLHLCANS